MERATNHGRARRALLAATFLIVAATLYGEETDFRELRWGMTVDEVKEIEGAPRHEWDNNLAYAVRVAGLDAYLFLEFESGVAAQLNSPPLCSR